MKAARSSGWFDAVVVAASKLGQIWLSGIALLLSAVLSLPSAHAAPGDVDALNLNIVGSFVYAIAVQPDGKTIIGGQFSSVLGQARNNIARLNADGTLDAGFNPNANSSVESIALQADGQILLGGTFTTVGGSPRNRIARVAADGTLDAGFSPNANGLVRSIVVQTDGQILLGGDFTTVGGSTRNRIARVAANGALDAGFDPNANATVYSIAVQADGQILLGGSFITIGGSTRNRIARVAANGTLDASFTPNANFDVISIAVQANGQILFVGFFTTVNGVTRDRIARVAANGTLDMGFNPVPNSNVFSIALQADGRILFGGEFTSVGGTPRNRIARVAADGMLDAGFNPNVNGDVRSIALQADGKILLGDVFTTVGGLPRNRFARLLNDPATQSLSALDTTQVLWTRGGSAPELGQATFELSTNGGVSYTPLGGIATRVGSTANWQLSGLSLPSSGQLRARGRTAGGFGNGSTGLVEQVAVFSFAPTVTAITPTSGVISGGTRVTITGTNFTGATAVTIGGVATGFFVVNATTITAITGAHAVGAVSVDVTTPAGTNTANTLYTYRVPGPGDVDALNLNIVGLGLSASAVQPDGKTIIGGFFTSVLGQPRNNIARLNADGTLDAVFNPGASDRVNSIAVQPDGQILLGGLFTTVGGITRNRIARVAANGTLDAGFNPDANSNVNSIAVQPDGQILLGGQFATVGGITRNRIARVAANGTLDAGFNPNANGVVHGITLQADGQILLGGGFTTVGGITRNRIARVAANGTLDAGFNPNANSEVYNIVPQADGQILLGGFFTSVGGITRNYIARIAANGTLDAGFDPNTNNTVYSISLQADGQILIGGFFTAIGGSPRNRIARVAPNGTLDAGFDPNADGVVSITTLQADGRILIGGGFSSVGGPVRDTFARLLNDPATQSLNTVNNTQVLWTRGGSAPDVSQTTFELSTDGGSSYTPLGGIATRVGSTANWQLNGLSLPSSGQLRARGRGGVGTSSSGLVEQVASITLPPPTVTNISPTSGITSGGTNVTITGTNFTGATAVTIGGVAATGANVINDTTITAITGAGVAGAVSVDVTTPGGTNTANTLYTYRVPGPGDVDALNLNIVGNFVFASAVQPDGKTIIGGQFSSVLGQARNNIARLNADGTLDASFNPNVNGDVYSIAVQADGQILLGGTFTTVGAIARDRIARVASGGTLDAGFNPNANGIVRSIVLQADGQILLGGAFTTVGGLPRNRIARVAANGALDAGFDPNANNQVYSIAVQADGQILLGGEFTSVGGITRNRIARVAANGMLDMGFDPNANLAVFSIAVQADGQIVFGGFFTTVGGVTRNRMARVATNGTLDTGFNPNVSNGIFSIVLQADGQILLGGTFTTVGGTARNRIARVAANGTLDTGFNPNANGDVDSIEMQANGQILLGGLFSTVGGSPRNRFARLLNDPATQSLSAVDATQVLWTRGGSAPELSQTTFELSTNGGASYTPLGGIATRVGNTANWQLSGLSLPASGQLRARGRTAGGFGNGSTGLVEQVASFSLLPDITSNLAAFYDCNGDGGIPGGIRDNTVNARHLTKTVNTPAFDPVLFTANARSGQACDFNARTKLQSAISAFTQSNTVTYAFWLNTGRVSGQKIMQSVTGADLSNAEQNLIDFTVAVAPQKFRVFGNSPDPNLKFRDTDATAAINDPVTVDQWHHLAVTSTGTLAGVELYIDGVQVSSLLGGIAPLTGTDVFDLASTFYLGARSTSGPAGPNFNGKLDDVRIYSRALTPSDIAELTAPPGMGEISNTLINEDSAAINLPFRVNDLQTPAGALVVTAVSSNLALLPNSNVTVGGAGENRVLTVVPVADMSGVSTVTVTVTDGNARTATQSFVLTVSPVNDAPSFVAGANQVLQPASNTAPQTIANWATLISDGDAAFIQSLTFNVSVECGVIVNCTSMFSALPAVSANGTLTFTPNGSAGLANVSVSLTDDASAGGAALTTAVQTFSILVRAIPVVTIIQPLPAETVVGEPFIVRVRVNNPTSAFKPSGSITVQPRPQGAAVTCALIPMTTPPGTSEAICSNVISPIALAKLIQFSYSGDELFLAPAVGGFTHTVNPAATRLTILSDTPDPSMSNSPVEVRFMLEVLPPSLSPVSSLQGSIVLNDGPIVASTSIPGEPVVNITLQGSGPRILMARYVGDFNFLDSNLATEPHQLIGSNDLSVGISNSRGFVPAAGETLYQVRVRNLGTISSSASLNALVPPGLDNYRWTCSASMGFDCPALSGTGPIVAKINILPEADVTYTIRADVTAAEGAQIRNRVEITPSITDDNPLNNSAMDTDVVALFADGLE